MNYKDELKRLSEQAKKMPGYREEPLALTIEQLELHFKERKEVVMHQKHINEATEKKQQ